jgi:hypothetical protein
VAAHPTPLTCINQREPAPGLPATARTRAGTHGTGDAPIRSCTPLSALSHPRRESDTTMDHLAPTKQPALRSAPRSAGAHAGNRPAIRAAAKAPQHVAPPRCLTGHPSHPRPPHARDDRHGSQMDESRAHIAFDRLVQRCTRPGWTEHGPFGCHIFFGGVERQARVCAAPPGASCGAQEGSRSTERSPAPARHARSWHRTAYRIL